eukprot:m.41084 g.41084  ORF g.41084 m.41084 type:complete len:548 (-) comp14106_c0_seq1:175-1818(-)
MRSSSPTQQVCLVPTLNMYPEGIINCTFLVSHQSWLVLVVMTLVATTSSTFAQPTSTLQTPTAPQPITRVPTASPTTAGQLCTLAECSPCGCTCACACTNCPCIGHVQHMCADFSCCGTNVSSPAVPPATSPTYSPTTSPTTSFRCSWNGGNVYDPNCTPPSSNSTRAIDSRLARGISADPPRGPTKCGSRPGDASTTLRWSPDDSSAPGDCARFIAIVNGATMSTFTCDLQYLFSCSDANLAKLDGWLTGDNGSTTAVSTTTSPSRSPTALPTVGSTNPSPTVSPIISPTSSSTPSPTSLPMLSPSVSPTTVPSDSPTTSPTVSPTMSPTMSPTVSPTDSEIASVSDDGGGADSSAFGIIIAVVLIVLAILFACGLVCYQRNHRAAVKLSPNPSATTNPTFSIQQAPGEPGLTVYEEIGAGDASQAVYEEPVPLANYSTGTPTGFNVYDVPTNIESSHVELDGNAYVAKMVSHNDVSAAENTEEHAEEHVGSMGSAGSSDARLTHLDKSPNANVAVVRQRGSFSLTKPLRRSETRDVFDDDDNLDV